MEENTITNFFNTDYISFASYDAYRKTASVVDGLKVSARKILYTCLEDNKANKLKKVEALSNRAAEFTDYHHGSNSLVGVIVGMAQRFVGSNNIPLLKADGAFGTRLNEEAAAPRYIFTAAESYVSELFNADDNAVLLEQFSDDQKIEPKFFVPVLPMLLVNGSVGLAVGFAQNILPRNPADLIKYINRKIAGQNSNNELLPYWNGFKGKVKQREPGVFDIYGHVSISKKTVIVDELPIGIGYRKYLNILDDLCEKKIISNYNDKCDTKTDSILFEIKFPTDSFKEILANPMKLIDILKLRVSETENYTCIDPNGRVKVYNSVFEIIDEYINVRLEYYNKRKEYITNKMTEDMKVMLSKCLFIKHVIDGTITLKNKTSEEVIKQIEQDSRIVKVSDSYDFLLKMPIYSCTKDKYEDLKNKLKAKKAELEEYKQITIQDMWKSEMNSLKL